MVGERAQGRRSFGERTQGGMGFGGQPPRLVPRALQSEDRRIGGFLRGEVFTGALAKLLAGLRDIENVIDHLEGETERAAKSVSDFNRAGVALALIAPKRMAVVSNAAVLHS